MDLNSIMSLANGEPSVTPAQEGAAQQAAPTRDTNSTGSAVTAHAMAGGISVLIFGLVALAFAYWAKEA